MKPWLAAAAIAGITLASFFFFPGHTWAQQDSQIYAAILEHMRDPSVLRNDILITHPHVGLTLYDELALALVKLTGLGLEQVLEGTQLAARAAGVWGVYLMATAAGLAAGPAMLTAGILSLGAVVAGPTVLAVEYEPVPRALAVPLLLLAVGLAARKRYLWAGVAATAAFVLHAPTIWPSWGVLVLLLLWRPAARKALIPLIPGAILLLLASSGGGEHPFGHLGAQQEQIQRLRASYVWVDTWARQWMPHYLLLFLAGAAAWWRVRDKTPFELQLFMMGMSVTGILSVPLTYVLLERLKWAVIPQVQPARALLFVVLAAEMGAAVAGARAAAQKRWPEALGWFTLAYLVPANVTAVAPPQWKYAAAAVLLAALAVFAAASAHRKWAPAVLVLAIAAGFARPVEYPRLHTPELAQLAAWARSSTGPDTVFLFPDAGYGASPGIFRAEALRALYVDWKGGGQVNHSGELGSEWWRRWQATGKGKYRPQNVPSYAGLGIDYMVLERSSKPPKLTPVYENPRYLVYRLP